MGYFTMRGRLVKNFMGVGGLKLAGLPIGLAASVLLARSLGPEAFGHYSFIMALIPLLALPVSGGIAQFITREVAGYRHDCDWANYRALVRSSFIWVLSLSAVVVSVFFIIYFFFTDAVSDTRWQLMSVAVFLVPLVGLNAVRTAVIKGLGRPFYSELPVLLIQPFIILMLILVVAHLCSLGATEAINIQIFSGWLTFFIGTLILMFVSPSMKKTKAAVASFKFGSLVKGVLPFSVMAAVSLLNTQMSTVLLGLIGSPEDVAGFRVADRGAFFVAFSLTAMNMTISPRLVKLYKQRDIVKMQKLVRFASRMALLFALPLSILLMVFGRQIITVLYGSEYAVIAYIPLVVLVVGQSINVFCGPVGNILAMGGFERQSLRVHVLALSVNILCCVLLIPKYGAVGAAFASSAGVVTWNIFLSFLSMRFVGVRPFPI